MAFVVSSVLAYGVDPVIEKEFASFALQLLKNSFTYELTLCSYSDSPNIMKPPPQPQTYSCELCGNAHHYSPNCLSRFSLQDLNLKLISDELMIEQTNELFKAMESMFLEYRQRDQAANLSTHTPEPSRCFNSICYDDDDDYDYKDSTIPLNEIISQHPPSIVITTSPPVLPFKDPESSDEDLVLIPSESEDTSRSDSQFILPSCDDFSPINIFEEKFVTFSNPLFNLNNDFSSSDDESLSDEDVVDDKVKIYSNPLFEFDDEYISSNVNTLFDEVLEGIECKDSYDSNLDESTFLVTPLSDVNEDEYFTSGDDVEILLHRDPSNPMMSVVFILEGFTDELPLEENDDLFDLESKKNEWKKILYDTPTDDLMTEDKIFDLMIHDQNFSPTYVSLPFEDRHYLFFTYVVRIFLPHITYRVVSPFLLSSGSEDTIFDPGISASHFSHRSGTFICFNDCPDFEDSRAHGFVHHLLKLLSFAYGNLIS
nr:hypothetical protein [Tanacetum cinerariifolium]